MRAGACGRLVGCAEVVPVLRYVTEAWFKRKPDISHLRVWGCLDYVFVQKDKQCSLQPHMEKCVFVGYQSGYKGWKFYNPTTQKYIICERAEFDERVFPGLAKYKATSPVNLTPPVRGHSVPPSRNPRNHSRKSS